MGKKLIEVALPLEMINEQAEREKHITQGHPAVLHLWWARRPLTIARAILWSSLIDDPSSHPELFPTEESQNNERSRLFEILSNLVIWENSNNEEVLSTAQAEMRKYVGEKLPDLLDPFSGGGTIPLEGYRLGLNVHAHDLNPVSVSINKALVEIPGRFDGWQPINPSANALTRASGYKDISCIAEDVKYYGEKLKNKVFPKLQ